MTRQTLSQLLKGQLTLPDIKGTVDAVLRDADGSILQHVHQHNMITEYLRSLFLPNGNITHHQQYVFINETTEAMHVKRNAMRTTLPGTWAMASTPSLDGAGRIWTYQVVFAVPPAQRTIRMIGLTRNISTNGYTNVKCGPTGIVAATLLSTPIVQPPSATLEVSYRLAIQRT